MKVPQCPLLTQSGHPNPIQNDRRTSCRVASSQVHCPREVLRLREMPEPTETDLALASRHVAEGRIALQPSDRDNETIPKAN
jgi:hypothetical protein